MILELAKDSFTARVAIAKQNFGEVVDLSLSNASKPVLTGGAIAILTNRGPYHINETLYKNIFERGYDRKVLSFYVQNKGYYAPISSDYYE